MRVMEYRVLLEKYVISNSDSENGSIDKAPIKIISVTGLEEGDIVTDNELCGIYDQVLAGETDYMLTSIWLCGYSLTLGFQHRTSGESANVYVYGDDELSLEVETEHSKSTELCRYSIDTIAKKRTNKYHGNKKTECMFRVTERRGPEKRILTFETDGQDSWTTIVEIR